MGIGLELKIVAKRRITVLSAIVSLLSLAGESAIAANAFERSCRSTCGNGATCLRVAKQVFSECFDSNPNPSVCLANNLSARDACRAGVSACRSRCQSCAEMTHGTLSDCQSSADPRGCVERVVSDFYACLRGAGGTGSCADYGGLATPGEIAQSPFPNAEAEVLAIEASGEVVAPMQAYTRIVGDLAAIRASNPAVRDIRAQGSWVPDELIIGFDEQGKAAVAAGTYADWDCPNALYGMSSIESHALFVLLHYDHMFNAPLLTAAYAVLPHVTYAEPNGIFGDGDDVCVSFNGQTYSYVFDAGSGDCLAGCIDHTYWGFSTSGTPGEITSLGTWSKASGNPPPWFMALNACTKWL
jgi:hypothetical protein